MKKNTINPVKCRSSTNDYVLDAVVESLVEEIGQLKVSLDAASEQLNLLKTLRKTRTVSLRDGIIRKGDRVRVTNRVTPVGKKAQRGDYFGTVTETVPLPDGPTKVLFLQIVVGIRFDTTKIYKSLLHKSVTSKFTICYNLL